MRRSSLGGSQFKKTLLIALDIQFSFAILRLPKRNDVMRK